MALVTIIIPTYNNREYLEPCINSIILHQATRGLFKIVIVNNGHKDSIPPFIREEIQVVHAGKNLGWEGGLKEGLKYADTPFVVFMNDDTYIPVSSVYWLGSMLEHFSDPMVAAVGPASNTVMGIQQMFIPSQGTHLLEVNFLIGFCMMVRKEYLEKVGGIDDSYPNHGDDLDLSIRFRKAGYKLLCDKFVFVWHHGFKTGLREKGSEWNSVKMTEDTNHYLIRKHGLKDFVKYIFHPVVKPMLMDNYSLEDSEGEIIRKYSNGEKIVELGCGHQLTVPNSTGLDIVPKGEYIPGLVGKRSVADMTVDIKEKLPLEDESVDTFIARHILEHMIDPITVLKDWKRVLKKGGKLIIAVPDHNIRNTIPMNYQHCHGYTRDSLKSLMEEIGFHTSSLEGSGNGVSLVGVFNKNGLQ